MPAQTKIAAAYIRVSTEDQVEYSPDAQLVEIQKYAAAHGYRLPREFVYMDEGISGKRTDKRTAFNRMIGTAKAKPKPFDAILLWKFSRFARNREDSIVYKSMLRRQLGIDVISISEPLADDKMSIIMEAMIEAMDEYYSINLAEEVKRGMTEKARRGELQATPAFGYRAENNVLVPVPEEAALVRAIFARFLSGEGLFPIAKWLNHMGVTTHRGGCFENRTVEYILRNPVYIGKLRWNPSGRTRRDFSNENIILSAAKHQPLLSQETWDAAQRRMELVKAQQKRHGRPATEHRHWLSGLVRCAACGSTLVFCKPHYWKCGRYTKGACHVSQHVSDETLTELFMTALRHDCGEGAPLRYRVMPHPAAEPELLPAPEEQQRQIVGKINRLRDAYLAGAEDLDSYRTAKTALETRLREIQKRREQAARPEAQESAGSAMREHLRTCVSVLEDPACGMETKHRVSHDTVEKCVYDKASNTFSVFYALSLPES